ncbi:hypothetical protein EG328_003643 [Venturia inaequalis]|uniref:Uncharacterized protein n=1 Tax=Venturia inaequalis TaxID=5025 RepID=A0A8H3Z6H1_VENIN|nr:hypothetical protein EG328_003643 [Venturia inaequalis]
MALVRRNYGRAADPIEIIDDTDDDAIETIDITDDDDVDKEAMSDMDSLPSDIEDDMHNENQGTDSLFYAYDVEKELDQFVVTPDIGRVIESIGTCRDIAKKLSSVAGEIEIDHAGQIELLLQAQKYMSPRTFIAFLGEIGVGKSKTVDSLLNCPDAAPTGDSGEAETQKPTEYQQKKDRHCGAVTGEIILYSVQETLQILKESLHVFRLSLYLEDEAEEYDIKEAAQAALNELTTFFGSRTSLTEHFLSDLSEGAEERILGQLHSWFHQISWPENDCLGVETADTPSPVHASIRTYENNRFWPFVKVIRFYLDSPLLALGVVLVDLPGVQDANRARSKMADAYLHHCQMVFVVAEIKRVIASEQVKKKMDKIVSGNVSLDVEHPGKYIRTAIVCTKSDEIDLKSGRRKMEQHGEPRAFAQLVELEKRIAKQETLKTAASNEVTNALAKIKKIRQNRKAAWMINFKSQFASAKAAQVKAAAGLRRCKKQLERMKAEKKAQLIQFRTGWVPKRLCQMYPASNSNQRLEVFCIDNDTYAKAAEKDNHIGVQSSGIKNLRRYCYQAAAESKLRAANNFITKRIPNLLNSMKLQIEKNRPKTSSKSHATIKFRKTVDAIRSKIHQYEAKSKLERTDSLQGKIVNVAISAVPKWTRKGKREARGWSGWHWSTYKSACLHDGCHYTRRQGNFDWNSDLGSEMQKVLETPWTEVTGTAVNSHDTCLLADELRRAHSQIQEYLGEIVRATEVRLPADFQQNVSRCTESMEAKLDSLKENVFKQVWDVRRQASGTSKSSYLLENMIPVYRKASGERGPGMAARQRGIIEGRIETGAIYKDTTEQIKNGLNTAIDVCFLQLFAGAHEELTWILDHLDVLETTINKPDPRRVAVLTKAWNDLIDLEEMHKSAVRFAGFAK